MIYQGFCGPSNPSQSVIADCERLINWYPERVESPAAPTGLALYPVPGQRAFCTVDASDVRGGWAMGGRAFVVSGDGFFEIGSDGTWTRRGTVANDGFPATITYNGVTGGHLLITSGTNAYCYVLATNALSTVLTGEAHVGGMINNRFLAFNKTNGKVRLSALNDGTTWDANLYFQRGQAADPWVTMVVSAPNVWLIGEESGEVWQDVGAYPQPFAPVSGATFNVGCASTWAAGIAGNVVTWLSRSGKGVGPIVAARGYTPQPISGYAVDAAIAGYVRDDGVSDAEFIAYDDQGHTFGAFSFPSSEVTWVYDFTMGMWHQRSSRSSLSGTDGIWSVRTHLFAFDRHLVGGRDSGVISEMDVSFGSENDLPIRRVRVAPPLWASSAERLIVSRLDLKVEAGLGLVSGQGSDPQVMLRTSTDGRTWGPERMAAAGKLGQYGVNCYWLAVGSSRKLWVPEIVVTDPIPWRIAGAEIQGRGFQQLARSAA